MRFAQSGSKRFACFGCGSALAYARLDAECDWCVDAIDVGGAVIDVAGDGSDGFWVLVSGAEGRCVVPFDAAAGAVGDAVRVGDDVVGVAGGDALVCYSESALFVGGERIDAGARIVSKPFEVSSNILCFLDDGRMLCFSAATGECRYISDAVRAERGVALSESAFICFGESAPAVFVSAQNFNRSSFSEFKTLLIEEEFGGGTFEYGNERLFLVNGGSVESLGFDMEYEEQEIGEFESEGKLLSVSNELVLFSDGASTCVIKSRKKNTVVNDKRTLDIIKYKEKIYQVLEKEIYCAGKVVIAFENPLISIDSTENSAVAITDKNEIMLFTKNFRDEHSSFLVELDGACITASCITSQFIVIAVFDEEKRNNGQLFILDYDLNSFGDKYSLPSPAISLIKQNDGRNVFGICKNNSIFKIKLSDKGLDSLSYVYIGKNILDVYYCSDDMFLFIDDFKVYIFFKDQIIWTGISNALSVCKFDSSIIYADKNNKVLSRKFNFSNISNRCLTFLPFMNFNEEIKQIAFFDDYKFILLTNSIEIYKDKQFIAKADSISATSIVIQKNYDNYIIYVLHTDNTNISVYQFKENTEIKQVYTQSFNEKISQILLFEDMLLFIYQKYIQISSFRSNMFVFDKLKFESECTITKAVAFDNYLWIVSENSYINVFKYNKYYTKFEIVAYSSDMFDITSLIVIDRLTAIIGERNGKISSIIIPNGASHGFYKQFNNNIAKTRTQQIFDTHDSITSLFNTGKNILYTTKFGRVGILAPIEIQEQYLSLQQIQSKLQTQFNEKYNFQLRQYSEANSIDYDFIESYQEVLFNSDLDFYSEVSNFKFPFCNHSNFTH